MTVDAASTTTLTTTLGNIVVPPATYYRHYSDATQYSVSIRKIIFVHLESKVLKKTTLTFVFGVLVPGLGEGEDESICR